MIVGINTSLRNHYHVLFQFCLKGTNMSSYTHRYCYDKIKIIQKSLEKRYPNLSFFLLSMLRRQQGHARINQQQNQGLCTTIKTTEE